MTAAGRQPARSMRKKVFRGILGRHKQELQRRTASWEPIEFAAVRLELTAKGQIVLTVLDGLSLARRLTPPEFPKEPEKKSRLIGDLFFAVRAQLRYGRAPRPVWPRFSIRCFLCAWAASNFTRCSAVNTFRISACSCVRSVSIR